MTLFTTLSFPLLTEFYKQWYHNTGGKNIKVLPRKITDLMTPIVLTFWCASAATYCKRNGVWIHLH